MWCGHDLPDVRKKSAGAKPTEAQGPPPPAALAGGGKCPQCERPFQVGAEHCQWCGRDLGDAEVEAPEMFCPCCEVPLIEMSNEGWTLFMCPDCRGAFITAPVLVRFEKMYASAPATREAFGNGQALGKSVAKKEHEAARGRFYRRCPQCGQQMSRRRYHRVSSIVVDECMGHGVWFDADEFAQAVAFLKHGGMEAEKMYRSAHPSPGTGEIAREIQTFLENMRSMG